MNLGNVTGESVSLIFFFLRSRSLHSVILEFDFAHLGALVNQRLHAFRIGYCRHIAIIAHDHNGFNTRGIIFPERVLSDFRETLGESIFPKVLKTEIRIEEKKLYPFLYIVL